MTERVSQVIFNSPDGKVTVDFVPSVSENISHCYFAQSAILRSAKARGDGTSCALSECDVMFRAQEREVWGLKVATDFLQGVKKRYEVVVHRVDENDCRDETKPYSES